MRTTLSVNVDSFLNKEIRRHSFIHVNKAVRKANYIKHKVIMYTLKELFSSSKKVWQTKALPSDVSLPHVPELVKTQSADCNREQFENAF